MEYRAFALKYRPQSFNEVVGQEYVVSSLKNAILKGRVHHAYLFSGPRGVGKTSLARIFAKALNCNKGPTVSPCGKCESCISITKGTSLDVIEIDGASNRGIDDIRALRENINLSPAHSRYKIYIIDEVHQITSDAFNALLKTLEEPPAHAKFIFATTHPQKVPPTILSRCQKFQFHLLPVDKITHKLRTITKNEGLNIEDGVLNSIAHAAGGSIRDAESLLDQIVPVALEKKEIKDLMSFLGIIDESVLNTMADYIVKRDAEKSLNFIQRFTEEGKDLGVLLDSIISHFRNILLCKVSPKTFTQLKDISPSAKRSIISTADLISVSDVLRIMDLFIYAKDISRKLNSVRIPLELAIIKFTSEENGDGSLNSRSKKPLTNDYVPRVYNKDRNSHDGKGRGHIEATQDTNKKNTDNTDKDKLPLADNDVSFDDIDIDYFDFREGKDSAVRDGKRSISEIHPKKGREEDASDSRSMPVTLNDISGKWPQIIAEMSKKRMSLASCLSNAELYSLEGKVLKLSFSREHSFSKEIVEDVKNIKYIEQYLDKYIGHNIGIKCFVTDKKKVNDNKDKRKITLPDIEEDERIVNDILDTFSGDIQSDNE